MHFNVINCNHGSNVSLLFNYLDDFSELSDRGNIKNPELADINLDNISDDDLSNLFQSEEVIKRENDISFHTSNNK